VLSGWDAKVDLEQQPLPPTRKKNRSQSKHKPLPFNLRQQLYRVTGVDLTEVDGLDVLSVQALISEIGLNMHRWPSEKHFASWLGLCPDHRISGGQVLHNRTRSVINRAADVLRMAAQSLKDSQSALGAFFRRLKARLGPAKAITATAHKLARIVYTGRTTLIPELNTTNNATERMSSKVSKNGPRLSATHWLKTRHLTYMFLRRLP
jgi:transposase